MFTFLRLALTNMFGRTSAFICCGGESTAFVAFLFWYGWAFRITNTFVLSETFIQSSTIVKFVTSSASWNDAQVSVNIFTFFRFRTFAAVFDAAFGLVVVTNFVLFRFWLSTDFIRILFT